MKELNLLFKRLRTMGLDARQSFMCCSGCAGAAIANEYRERLLKDPAFSRKGFVYNHKQDQLSGNDLRRAKVNGRDIKICLRYGPVEATGDNFNFNGPAVQPLTTIGLSPKEIGDLIVEACKAEGLEYEWNGDPNEVVYVLPFGRAEAKARAS